MMYSTIKSEIKEIVQIVNECPPSLQERCFEVLLSHLLMEVGPAAAPIAEGMAAMATRQTVKVEEKVQTKIEEKPKVVAKPKPAPIPEPEPVMEMEPEPESQPVVPEPEPEPEPVKVKAKPKPKAPKKISIADFHDNVQEFLSEGSITAERINYLYARERNAIKPRYTDLATDQPNVVQICLALLTAFENSLYSGEFEFEIDQVQARCKDMEFYDADGFSKNFENVNQLFEDGADFEKGNIVQLSDIGKSAVLEVLEKIR